MSEYPILNCLGVHPRRQPRRSDHRVLDRLNQHDLRVELLSNYGDVITVAVVEGKRIDPDCLLYVERRGMYEGVREGTLGARRLVIPNLADLDRATPASARKSGGRVRLGRIDQREAV